MPEFMTKHELIKAGMVVLSRSIHEELRVPPDANTVCASSFNSRVPVEFHSRTQRTEECCTLLAHKDLGLHTIQCSIKLEIVESGKFNGHFNRPSDIHEGPAYP